MEDNVMSKRQDEASKHTPKNSDAKKTKPSPDLLARSGKKADIELSEEELKRVAGGCATGKHFPTA